MWDSLQAYYSSYDLKNNDLIYNNNSINKIKDFYFITETNCSTADYNLNKNLYFL